MPPRSHFRKQAALSLRPGVPNLFVAQTHGVVAQVAGSQISDPVHSVTLLWRMVLFTVAFDDQGLPYQKVNMPHPGDVDLGPNLETALLKKVTHPGFAARPRSRREVRERMALARGCDTNEIIHIRLIDQSLLHSGLDHNECSFRIMTHHHLAKTIHHRGQWLVSGHTQAVHLNIVVHARHGNTGVEHDV